jgi:transcriptional regulator with XRE-family HTH domain
MVQKQVNRPGTKRVTHKIELTLGESLFLLRKRNSWNQARAAKRCGISIDQYKMLEHDNLKKIPQRAHVSYSELLPHELCLIYRRRAGLKQEFVAEQISVSRYWFGRIESGKADCSKLLAYWLG